MTLTEMMDSFKTKLNISKFMDSLEKKASFYDELENGSEENDSGENLKTIHTIILEMILLKVLMQ